MFAGIVKGMGQVRSQTPRGGDSELVIGRNGVDLGPLKPGDSIAVNGVCLTATTCDADSFTADVSAETIAVTTLAELGAGDYVNLEGSLRLGDQIAGHLVYGHVDAVGRVESMTKQARSIRLNVTVPAALTRYLAPKGSVAVDGVSLTINEVGASSFAVNVIPHTLTVTAISNYAPGTPVNIEVDMIARYLHQLRQCD